MMILIAVFEYIVLASTFTIGKIAVGFVDPFFLVGVRMLISAPLLLIFYYIFQTKGHSLSIAKRYIHPSDVKKFFLVAIFHIFLPFAGEFWSLQYMASMKAALIYSLTPFIALLLSYILLKERLYKRQILGLLIGLCGLVAMFSLHSDGEYLLSEFLNISLPEIVLLACVTSASYAWFLVSDLMKKGYGISFINGWAMLIGGLMSLFLWFITSEGRSPLTYDKLPDFLFWTLLLVLMANVIGYNLYGWLLKRISISFMSAIGFLCPIFAAFFGWYFLNEDIGLLHLFALLMVIIGLWLFYSASLAAKVNSDGVFNYEACKNQE